MQTLVLYALLTSSMFYLGSRATITQFLWGRYPTKLATFMDCSACSGTWYGSVVGAVGSMCLELPFMGIPSDSPAMIPVVALCSMTWTPIIAGLMQKGFDTLGQIELEDSGA